MSAKAASFTYPIFLNLTRRVVVVVGAGPVGRRKVQRLLEAGALVRLVDPVLVNTQSIDDRVNAIARNFVEEDLEEAVLVFACTNSPETNHQVSSLAEARQVFCCRADQGDAGDFILPAMFSRGNLQVAVSSGGESPFFAQEVCRRLDQSVPDWWGFSLELLAGIRRKMLTEKIDDQYNQQVLRSFLADQLLPLIEQNNMSEINQLLVESFGNEFSLEQLQVQLPEGIS